MIQNIIFVSRLVEARRRALRRGIWFRLLGREERSIMNLTIRCVDRVRSAKLAKIVTAITVKLNLAMESTLKRLVRTVGRLMAQKLSQIAQGLGNHSAVLWAEDLGFVQFLAVMHMNTPQMFLV